jgi:peptidoglycan/LPS O-acetylase OafA/YrhL
LGHGIDNGMLINAAAYTVFHVLAFVGVGVLASMLVHVSRRIPQIAAGFVIFFAVFEVGFYFLAMMISKPDILGALAWYQIGAANLIAAAMMGGYLWRRHPELGPTFEHSLDGSV